MFATIFALFAIGLVFLGYSFYLYKLGGEFLDKAREEKKLMEVNHKKLDQLVQNKYNRVALLNISEFDQYMTKVFSMCMELATKESVSEKDPDAAVKLFAKTLERVEVYLGTETITAIDYFYGKDFLIRWCEMRFNLLNSRMYLPKIIDKSIYAESIESALNEK